MSGLLGGIFSAGNSMKRKLGGLLSDPLGTIQLGSQRMAEDTNLLSRLASEAGYMPNTVNRADQSVLVGPEQKALARALLADKGAEMGMAAATVWHGSPHKFDKFDSSKIGTGEGAQAYGHGLYLAENRAVADGYRKGGNVNPSVTIDGQAPTNWAGANRAEYTAMPQDAKLALRALADHKDIAMARQSALMDGQTGVVAALDDFVKSGRVKAGADGELYKVDLPDNAIARMLDWDKPLSQQSKEVQDAIEAAGYWSGDSADTGARLYQALRMAKGEKLYGPNVAPQASQRLKEMGIPGIRYLDGGSRGAGQGSSNFVVFPGQEDILKILERNGVPIK